MPEDPSSEPIKITLFPVWEAHEYTIHYNYLPEILASGYDESKLADFKFEYAPGQTIELEAPTLGVGYELYPEMWWITGSLVTNGYLYTDNLDSGMSDGDTITLDMCYGRQVSFNIDCTLTEDEKALGNLRDGYQNATRGTIVLSAGGSNISELGVKFTFSEDGQTDVFVADQNEVDCKTISRHNYTLLGYSRTPGGEPSWEFTVPATEHISTLTLTQYGKETQDGLLIMAEVLMPVHGSLDVI